MPYVGRDLQRGNYLKLDDIGSSFNGSTTTFNLTSGGNAFFPGSAFSILVSLGGVVQEPESAYQIDRSQIIFATAPTSSSDFFCIALGVALGVGVPGHNTVNNDQLAKPLSYGDYFRWDSANNRVGINTLLPSTALDVVGSATFSGNVSIGGTLTYEDVANIDAVGIITARAGIEDKTLTTGRVVYVGSNSRLVDNANFTFDGTDVGIARSIFHLGDTNTSIGFDAADNIEFITGGSERLRIESGGGLKFTGQGTSIPVGGILHHTNNNLYVRGGTSGLVLGNQNNTNTIHISESNYIKFETNDGSEKLRITSDGNIYTTNDEVRDNARLTITKGHVGISTVLFLHNNNGSGKAAKISSSKGLVLGADVEVNSGTDASFISFETDNSEKLRITSDGEVGIGTDNPDQTLELFKASGTNLVKVTSQANSTVGLEIEKTGATTQSWRIADGQTVNGALEFYDVTDSKRVMGIDGSGRVIIGSGNHAGGSQLVIKGGDINSYSTLGMFSEHTNPAADTLLSQIRFGSNTTAVGADIRATADAAWGTNDYPTRLSFYTTPDSSNSRQERLRINSGGNLQLGSAADPGDALRYLDIYNLNTGGSAGSILRFITRKSDGSASVSADIVKYKTGGLYINNNEVLGTTGFISFGTGTGGGSVGERLRIGSNGGTMIQNAGTLGTSTNETLYIQGEGHNGHGTTNTRSVVSITGAISSNNNSAGLWIGARTNTNTAVIGTRTSTGNLAFETYSGGWGERMRLTYNGSLNIGGDFSQSTYTMKVTGSFAATTKSFVIDHPTKENHTLRYACLEGPENSVYVRGKTSDSVIELPDYWQGLVHDDSITVNVTPIGNHNVWVESINNNSVTIGSDGSEYFYTVFAERKDVDKLEVEVAE